MKKSFVYIVSNRKRTAFYTGSTHNLGESIFEQREGTTDRITRNGRAKYLMYYEAAGSLNDAIAREKQLKNWHRDWKISLIKTSNPDMKDLTNEVLALEPNEIEPPALFIPIRPNNS
jgi:putative endonuclease